MNSALYDTVRAVSWTELGLVLLDQRLLPARCETLLLQDCDDVVHAIRDMVVRGAPAIGITAAYGVVLAARTHYAQSANTWRQALEEDLERLAQARPTAINLRWALERMRRLLPTLDGDPVPLLLAEAQLIHAEDIAANRRMGELGAALIEGPCDVLTHCNAGALATGGYGTALGVIRAAHAAGKVQGVLADETRPWFQGARLTAWELVQDRIPVRLITDAAATYAMKQDKVKWVIVGADRIAANGDVANKIGTYGLAVSARYHGIKFMVAAPTSTIDMTVPDGTAIPIEVRPWEEVLLCGDRRIAADGAAAWNPVFDVTPAALIDAIVTERGVVHGPSKENMAALMASAQART